MANFDVQTLFDLAQVLAQLATQVGKTTIIIRLQSQLLGDDFRAGHGLTSQCGFGSLGSESYLKPNSFPGRKKGYFSVVCFLIYEFYNGMVIRPRCAA